MKRFWLGLSLIIAFGLMSSCAGTRALMQTAPKAPKGAAAKPAIHAADLNIWTLRQRSAALRALSDEVYGYAPDNLTSEFSAPETVNDSALGGAALIEETVMSMTSNGKTVSGRIVVVTPKNPAGPVPIIIMQNFCPNADVLPEPGITPPPGGSFDCSGGGALNSVFGYFFGRYIVSPPANEIVSRGYALAIMHPPDWIADSAQPAIEDMTTMMPGTADSPAWGAIRAWAQLSIELAAHLDSDPRFNDKIAYGHSRYGKSALVAAAFSDKIDGVIAHQSGTGGASLNRDKPGETVAAITKGYPHWFSKSYADFAGNEGAMISDQHFLLSVIAPRPILLGNAKRDVWSDPEGAFRAAKGAGPVYALYGKDGLTVTKLADFNPEDDIAFWIRPGTHGVTTEDWPAFLSFLDAHFK